MPLSRVTRYLVREIVLAWFAVTLVLVVVLLTNRLVQFLSDAVSGDVPPGIVFNLLGLKALSNLSTVLSASFFLAIMLALGRLYRDSEMAAMTACGIGPGRVYRALFAIGVPLALVVALCATLLAPWAEDTADRTLAEAQQKAQFQGLQPGRFMSFAGGRVEMYVGDIAADGTMRDVFAHVRDEDGDHLVISDRGRRQRRAEDGADFLVLQNGERYDYGKPGTGWRIMDFAEHGVRLRHSGTVTYNSGVQGTPTRKLLESPTPERSAELQWRLATAIATLVLTFISLPLARSAPRDGRYARLVAAVLIFLVYFNLIKATQDWIGKGEIPAWIGMWWVHGLFALGGLVLLAVRFQVFARLPEAR
ncbi:MAG TPA: LPS export ABC transporter permease LptF [Gammaproteobacteria bacterium]|nr:LPS export ABC transporter permease LptF [Gammaproteobacteria bacterium]